MEYFLTKTAGDSTKILLFTSQISDIEAKKYPIDILCMPCKEIMCQTKSTFKKQKQYGTDYSLNCDFSQL